MFRDFFTVNTQNPLGLRRQKAKLALCLSIPVQCSLALVLLLVPLLLVQAAWFLKVLGLVLR